MTVSVVVGKGKKKKGDVVLDIKSGDAVGALFTKQWPEIKHVFQSPKLNTFMAKNTVGYVAEKLDGSNLAVTSNGVISSRRNILLKDPSDEELKKFKFSGVTLSKLVGIFEKVLHVKNRFQEIFPFLEIELILYGELIQKGTATCKEDKFNYRTKGIDQGEFHIFGGGVAFEEKLDSSQIETALKHLKGKGFSVISNKNDLTDKSHLVILMNDHFANVLNEHKLGKVIEHKTMTLNEIVDSFKDQMLKNEIEGVVVNFGDEILKWKGLDESYPDIFIDEINELKDKIIPIVFNAFMEVACKARQERDSMRKDKATEILLEKAYKSAMSKVRSLEEQRTEGELSDKLIDNFETMLEEEMMKDCHFDTDFKKKIKVFIKSKTMLT